MRVKLGGLYFDRLTLDQAVDRILSLAARTERDCSLVVTPNVDHVLRCQKSPELGRLYGTAALSLADGMPIVWLSRLIGNNLPARVTGADLLPALCRAASREQLSVFLFGGPPGAADGAAQSLRAISPGLVIHTYCPPFGFEQNQLENSKAIAAINAAGADILFVGLGSPKQELWLGRWRSRLQVAVALGVGAAIEFEAGTVARAPKWMQNAGLEWLFRFMTDPVRLAGRYLSNIMFLRVIGAEIVRKLKNQH